MIFGSDNPDVMRFTTPFLFSDRFSLLRSLIFDQYRQIFNIKFKTLLYELSLYFPIYKKKMYKLEKLAFCNLSTNDLIKYRTMFPY